MTKCKYQNAYDAVKLIFLCFMTVYVAVREVSPLHFLIGSQIVSAAVFLCGFGLIVAGWFASGACFADRRTDVLALFIAVTALSCAINFKYGFADNIKALGALVLFFFLLFDAGIGKPPARRRYEIDCITGVLCVVWALFTLISFSMFMLSIYYSVDEGGSFAFDQGFSTTLNRLWGVFHDPNYAGFITDVTILASARFIVNTRKAAVRAVHIVNILLQIGFLTLAGSRSANLILIAGTVVFVFHLLCAGKNKPNGAKKYLKNAAAAGLCGAVCLGLIIGGQYLLPYVRSVNALLPERIPCSVTAAINAWYERSDLEILDSVIAYGEDGISFDPGNGPIKRTDTTEDMVDGDVSHGRFDRWSQTLQIFSSTPVFGTSPRNLSSYAKQYYPDTLMAKYGMVPHNGYLDILAGTGVLGAAVFLLFFIPAVIALLKKYFQFEDDIDFTFSAATAFMLAASALFVSDLFFMVSVGAFFFWTFFGYALHTDEKALEKKGILMKLYEKIFRRKEQTP